MTDKPLLHVYLEPRYGNAEYLIGHFDDPALAMQACQDDHDTRKPDGAPPLVWKQWDDGNYTADCRVIEGNYGEIPGTYTLDVITLNEPVRWRE